MSGTYPPSLVKEAGACLLVALLVSLLVGFGFAVSGLDEFTALETTKISAGMAAFAFPFIATGILFVGIPALILARKTGFTLSIPRLCRVGTVAGAIASPLVSLLAFRNSSDGWAILATVGASCGLLAALLWWHLIEKHKGTDSSHV